MSFQFSVGVNIERSFADYIAQRHVWWCNVIAAAEALFSASMTRSLDLLHLKSSINTETS